MVNNCPCKTVTNSKTILASNCIELNDSQCNPSGQGRLVVVSGQDIVLIEEASNPGCNKLQDLEGPPTTWTCMADGRLVPCTRCLDVHVIDNLKEKHKMENEERGPLDRHHVYTRSCSTATLSIVYFSLTVNCFWSLCLTYAMYVGRQVPPVMLPLSVPNLVVGLTLSTYCKASPIIHNIL